MDAEGRKQIIDELCAFERRLAGSDAERRAAKRLAERLREGGRRAETEPIYVHPQYGLVFAAHAALAFAGSLAAIEVPALGFALVLVAATSMYLDLNFRVYLLRSLFFRRASQNVYSPGLAASGRTHLILCAHLDAPRSGASFTPARARRWARLASRFPALGPFRLVFWSMAALLPLLGARMAGLDTSAVSLLQLLPTLVLLVSIFALLDIQLSDVTPGANSNASGVAAALSLADELDRDPPESLRVSVLLTSGAECLAEGTRAFLRAHRRDLDRERTVFFALEQLGGGEVRFETRAGWVISYEMDRRLVELAAAIAESGESQATAVALRRGSGGDAMPARTAGYRAISITARTAGGIAPHVRSEGDRPEAIDPLSLTRAHDFALELIRRFDRDLARRGATPRDREPAGV